MGRSLHILTQCDRCLTNLSWKFDVRANSLSTSGTFCEVCWGKQPNSWAHDNTSVDGQNITEFVGGPVGQFFFSTLSDQSLGYGAATSLYAS